MDIIATLVHPHPNHEVEIHIRAPRFSVIAKKLDVRRQTIYDFLERTPEAKKYLDEAKEEIIDMAETKLVTAMNNGDLETIKWYLPRIAKIRGYGNNPEFQVIGKQTNTQINIDTNIHDLIEKARNKEWKSQSQTSDL